MTWQRIKSGGRRGYWRRRFDDGRQATVRPVVNDGWLSGWRWALRDADGQVLASGNTHTHEAGRRAADQAHLDRLAVVGSTP